MRKENAAKEKEQKEAARALEQIEAVSVLNSNCIYFVFSTTGSTLLIANNWSKDFSSMAVSFLGKLLVDFLQSENCWIRWTQATIYDVFKPLG